MHTFKDESGNEWRLSLSYAVLKRMKAAGLDVFEFLRNELGDFETLVRILWVWLEPQLDAKCISPDQFAELLCGEALARSYDAIRQEALDFLSHTNPPLATVLRKAVEAEGLLRETALNAAQSISLSETCSI